MSILIKQATKKGYIECVNGGVFDASYPTSKLRRGRVQGGGEISPTLTSQGNGIRQIRKDNGMYRIRKLTPFECGKLMGFTEKDTKIMLSVNSHTQVYKQCGNSIVRPVLMAIFSQLNIQGIRPWNELTNEECNELIEKADKENEKHNCNGIMGKAKND